MSDTHINKLLHYNLASLKGHDNFKIAREILGVSNNASSEVITKAYRGLALHVHPDRNKGNRNATEAFKILYEAYTVLVAQFVSETERNTPSIVGQANELLPQQIDGQYNDKLLIDEVEPVTGSMDLDDIDPVVSVRDSENINTLADNEGALANDAVSIAGTVFPSGSMPDIIEYLTGLESEIDDDAEGVAETEIIPESTTPDTEEYQDEISNIQEKEIRDKRAGEVVHNIFAKHKAKMEALKELKIDSRIRDEETRPLLHAGLTIHKAYENHKKRIAQREYAEKGFDEITGLRFDKELLAPAPAQVTSQQEFTDQINALPLSVSDKEILIEAYKKKTHMKFVDVIKALEENLPQASYIVNKHSATNSLPGAPAPIRVLDTPNKSNGWFCDIADDYFTTIHEDKYSRLRMDGISDAFAIRGTITNGSSLVYMDDCSYSGTQLLSLVKSVNGFVERSKLQNIKLVLILPYMTSYARQTLTFQIQRIQKDNPNLSINMVCNRYIPNVDQALKSFISPETIQAIHDEGNVTLAKKLQKLAKQDPVKINQFLNMLGAFGSHNKALAFTDSAVPDSTSTPNEFPGKLFVAGHNPSFITTSGKPYKLNDDIPYYSMERLIEYLADPTIEKRAQKLVAVTDSGYNMLSLITSRRFTEFTIPAINAVKNIVESITVEVHEKNNPKNTKNLLLAKMLSNPTVYSCVDVTTSEGKQIVAKVAELVNMMTNQEQTNDVKSKMPEGFRNELHKQLTMLSTGEYSALPRPVSFYGVKEYSALLQPTFFHSAWAEQPEKLELPGSFNSSATEVVEPQQFEPPKPRID